MGRKSVNPDKIRRINTKKFHEASKFRRNLAKVKVNPDYKPKYFRKDTTARRVQALGLTDYTAMAMQEFGLSADDPNLKEATRVMFALSYLPKSVREQILAIVGMNRLENADKPLDFSKVNLSTYIRGSTPAERESKTTSAEIWYEIVEYMERTDNKISMQTISSQFNYWWHEYELATTGQATDIRLEEFKDRYIEKAISVGMPADVINKLKSIGADKLYEMTLEPDGDVRVDTKTKLPKFKDIYVWEYGGDELQTSAIAEEFRALLGMTSYEIGMSDYEERAVWRKAGRNRAADTFEDTLRAMLPLVKRAKDGHLYIPFVGSAKADTKIGRTLARLLQEEGYED